MNPDVAPMNKAWLSGYLTKEEMEHEHPRELEEIEELEVPEVPENSEESQKS